MRGVCWNKNAWGNAANPTTWEHSSFEIKSRTAAFMSGWGARVMLGCFAIYFWYQIASVFRSYQIAVLGNGGSHQWIKFRRGQT